MDQQNQTPNEAPRRPMTAEEIARAESEAVAAMLRGETPTPVDASAPVKPAQAASQHPDFVPYVDDVVEPEAPAPADDSAAGDAADDEPYIPGAMEQRIDALPEKKWNLYQTIGGAVLGLASVGALLAFSGDLSMYGLAVAAALVLIVPRYLERAWNHKLPVARRAMLIAMIVGLVAMIVVTGLTTGFVITKSK